MLVFCLVTYIVNLLCLPGVQSEIYLFMAYPHALLVCVAGSKMSLFDSDPKFCPECGTIFPLPTGGEYISCMNTKCRYQVPVSG